MTPIKFWTALIAVAFAGLAVTTALAAPLENGTVTHFQANGEGTTFTATTRIAAVKLVKPTASKYYELRQTTTTGDLLWKHYAETAPIAGTHPAYFTVPPGVGAMYFVTDDTTTGTPLLTIYRKVD